MATSFDRLFVLPRLVLAAKKIDLYDAINLVVYAKVPLIRTRCSKELVAGFIGWDNFRGIPAFVSTGLKEKLLEKYSKEIASFRYPVAPSQYEPLLEKMAEAKEPALPYFFHEHHELKERRRRAAMFVMLHRELASLVGTKEVAIQITDSERTNLMMGDAWMTAETFSAYLERNGVTTWWRNQENLNSHARLERVLMSDGIAVPHAELSTGYDEDQLPSFLFAKMLLSRSGAMRSYPLARELTRVGPIAESPIKDRESADTHYKSDKRKDGTESLQGSAPSSEVGFDEDDDLDCSITARPSMIEGDLDPNKTQKWASAENTAGEQRHDSRSISSGQAGYPDDVMLTKREVAALLGVSMNTVNNYRGKYSDFPGAISYGVNALRWSKMEIERWKKTRPIQ